MSTRTWCHRSTPTDGSRSRSSGRLCEDLIAAGVHGLVPLGSTGEFAYLNPAQRERIVSVVTEAAAGRVPVTAGVAALTTADAVGQARRYAELGCDGILAILEAYFPLDDDAIHDYFAAVAHATDRPVVLYTNPTYQRADLSLPVIERLSHLPTVRYLKDASGDTGRLLTVMDRVQGRLEIFAASAHIPAAVMLIGGRGWMAGPACLAPRQSVALYELCRAGDWPAAMTLQRSLWRLNQAFAAHNLAACIKGRPATPGLRRRQPASASTATVPGRPTPSTTRTRRPRTASADLSGGP